MRSMIQSRTFILPSSIIAFMRSTVANDEPASWNDVMPLATTSADASSSTLRSRARSSSGVRGGSPAPRRISRDAVSRKRPVGLPFASLMKSPPAGFAVLPVTPDNSIAFALAKLAWPLACVSRTGLFGDTLLSASWSGNPSTLGSGFAVHFSWCQPRP